LAKSLGCTEAEWLAADGLMSEGTGCRPLAASRRLRQRYLAVFGTALRERLVKIGARIGRHGCCLVFQLAEVVVRRALFTGILRRIDRLREPPVVAA
jgi:hypothetical protein